MLKEKQSKYNYLLNTLVVLSCLLFNTPIYAEDNPTDWENIRLNINSTISDLQLERSSVYKRLARSKRSNSRTPGSVSMDKIDSMEDRLDDIKEEVTHLRRISSMLNKRERFLNTIKNTQESLRSVERKILRDLNK